VVDDRLQRRIRKPADLLRCLACAIVIVVLAVLGIVASATTTGVETNIVEVSRSVPRCPSPWPSASSSAASLAGSPRPRQPASSPARL
jgi:TRAP-type C4-dicarboxylate transport system permease small subunit